MYDKTVFANRLKSKRIEYGWDQHALADRSGVKVGSIREYERGASTPGFDKACALADALGVSVAWLVEPIEEPQAAPRA